MRALAITGMVTAEMMPSIMSGSLIRDTPPCARMSAGTRSSAITATAPAPSAIRACSGVTTSMITPPLSISARPRLTRAVPVRPEPFDEAALSTADLLQPGSPDSSAGRQIVFSSASQSPDGLQLTGPIRRARQGNRLGEQLRKLQRIHRLAGIGQLGDVGSVTPTVSVDVAALQFGAAHGGRLEAFGAVDEEEFLAVDRRAVEVEHRIAPPHRPDDVGGIDPQTRLLGQFTSRGLRQGLPVPDLTTHGEPPSRRAPGLLGRCGVRSA